MKDTTPFFSLSNRWMPFLLLVVLVFVVIGTIRMYGKNRRTSIAKESVEEEIFELESQHQDLEQDLARLETERGVEETLRDQYHVKREGEQQIVIIENEPEKPEKSEYSWFYRLFH